MRYFAFLTLFLVMFTVSAETSTTTTKHSFSSSVERVALVELYTSEGCSSCPPADRWLSKLNSSDKLWDNFVPVAFHVDYWDYIGWKDRFASKAYSQRQRRYAKEQGERTVYTPGVRIGGQEFRSWRHAKKLERLDKGSKVGVLTLDVKTDGTFVASFDAHENTQKVTNLHVALLGMELLTKVERGENRGKQLEHDFVVLDLKTVKGSNNQFTGVLPKQTNNEGKLAIAAWVDSGHSQTPIQTVGGFL